MRVGFSPEMYIYKSEFRYLCSTSLVDHSVNVREKPELSVYQYSNLI
uniref:Uncharacterized protein n=1 Tax=Anguilla anguilla TaxID=7936 RepID=A0A0E9QIP1_ANGAN